MPTEHFTPPINDKRTMKKGDWAGWYQVTIARNGTLVAACFWWNGSEWNHGPNWRHGFNTPILGDVRGIVRLVDE